MYYFESKTNDPYLNLASEYSIFTCQDEGLYLWINSPSIILGRNQCALKEFNAFLCEKHSINIVRRYSGGGCVYHDEGNLNFTFFCKELNKEKYLSIIIEALKQFNIDAYISGRNDLCVNGYKVSGTAYLCENDFYMFHGTLLVNSNLNLLSSLLTPHFTKFIGKGIDSVKERVRNLNEFSHTITIQSLKEAIYDTYIKYYPETIKKDIPLNLQEYHKIKDKKWIYQDDIYQLHIDTVCHHKQINCLLTVNKEIITDIKIYHDELDIHYYDDFIQNLINKPITYFYKAIGK